MSPNSIKNLTYVAVALCVVALVFLIYNSIRQRSADQPELIGNIDMETITGEDSLYADSEDLSSYYGEAPGAVSDDEVTGPEVTEGDIVSGGNASSSSGDDNRGVAEITIEDGDFDEPISADRPSVDAPSKTSGSSKSANMKTSKTAQPKPSPGTPAGNTKPALAPTLYVVTGSFINKEGAAKMVASLKKQGYPKSEVVKSGDKYWASAGKYNNRKEADALVKQLSANKITALVRTKT